MRSRERRREDRWINWKEKVRDREEGRREGKEGEDENILMSSKSGEYLRLGGRKPHLHSFTEPLLGRDDS